MRKTLTAVVAIWMLGALACGGTTDPASEHNPPGSAVSAAAAEDGLKLSNPTTSTIYFTVFERNWAMYGLFLWALCVDPATCPSVEAGATVTIPYSAIGGYTPEAREAIVYYWELIPDGDDYRAGAVRSFVVPF